MLKSFIKKLMGEGKKTTEPITTANEKVPGRERAIYNIKFVDKSELSHHPNLFDQLIDQEIDGLVIHNFINPATAGSMDQELINKNEFSVKTNFGQLVGFPTMISTDRELTQYFEKNKGVYEVLKEITGIPIDQELINVMQSISSKRKVGPFYRDNDQYLIGSLRSFEPNLGGLPAHTGNAFAKKHEESNMWYHHNQLAVKNSFSYFSLLQEADKGGELVLFDLKYEDTPEHSVVSLNNVEEAGKVVYGIDFQTITLKEGDLLMFRGGDIWHQVNPIYGSRPRVTFGGFFAKHRSDQSVHLWS